MKRIKFKKPFNGMDKALKLIPESYKVDGHEFEMTDGNETYRVKWESDLNEGSVLNSGVKSKINEDMSKMKHLMGFKSEDTLGTVKGAARIIENKKFGEILGKSKSLISESKEPVSELLDLMKDKDGNFPDGVNADDSDTKGEETEDTESKKKIDETLNEMGGAEETGIPSQISLGQKMKAMGASISEADFEAKERLVVSKLLGLIEKLAEPSNGYSSQVKTKLEYVSSAIDDAMNSTGEAESEEEPEGTFNEDIERYVDDAHPETADPIEDYVIVGPSGDVVKQLGMMTGSRAELIASKFESDYYATPASTIRDSHSNDIDLNFGVTEEEGSQERTPYPSNKQKLTQVSEPGFQDNVQGLTPDEEEELRKTIGGLDEEGVVLYGDNHPETDDKIEDYVIVGPTGEVVKRLGMMTGSRAELIASKFKSEWYYAAPADTIHDPTRDDIDEGGVCHECEEEPKDRFDEIFDGYENEIDEDESNIEDKVEEVE